MVMENKENKYYTPELDELFIGQTVVVVGSTIRGKDTFEEKILDEENLLAYKNSCLIRYLSRKDIESLGFEYDNNAEPIPSRKEGYDPCIAFLIEKDNAMKQWQLFLFPDRTVWIDYTFDCAGFGYVFKGIIKNKSELKRILKQIGVL
jgi:hypothetical protein